jgi:hypothetical protein
MLDGNDATDLKKSTHPYDDYFHLVKDVILSRGAADARDRT